MIELKVEDEFDLKCFINGIPSIDNIPPEKWYSIMSVLEMEISKFYEKSNLDKEKK